MDNYSQQQSKEGDKGKWKKKKKGNNNNKPIKVVYISNPMKVKTCPSKFRALVQELTGQDSELPDPTKFTDTHGGHCGGEEEEEVVGAEAARVVEGSCGGGEGQSSSYHPLPLHHDHHDHEAEEEEKKSTTTKHDDDDVDVDGSLPLPLPLPLPLESLDEVFTPQMLDNLTGFFPPSLLL